jgi:uncharacterized membrane protein
MDAVIRPNRSLSPRGLKILLGFVIGWNLVLAVFCLAIGAFPVPVFLGLDVLGVWIAFRVSNRRAQRTEHVRVDADRVTVARDWGGGEKQVWSSPTAFTRIEPVEGAVRVVMSGKAVWVAQALSAPERSDFARALQTAVLEARKERG